MVNAGHSIHSNERAIYTLCALAATCLLCSNLLLHLVKRNHLNPHACACPLTQYSAFDLACVIFVTFYGRVVIKLLIYCREIEGRGLRVPNFGLPKLGSAAVWAVTICKRVASHSFMITQNDDKLTQARSGHH